MPTQEQLDALSRIATPTAVGLQLNKQALGFDYTVPPHIAYIERRVLDAVLDPKPRFLIVTMPPRHAKSFTIGRLLPLWHIGLFPEKQVIYASYSDEIAADTGSWVKDAMTHFGPSLFGRGVSTGKASAAIWRMQGYSVGGMISVGRGSAITGRPGHLIIGDDLIKNPREANSAAERRALLDWYDEVLRTRLEPGGTIILFFTRWRVDDLIGTLIERQESEGWRGDQYEVINLPALAVPPIELDEEEREAWRDVLGRAAGDALWPERFDVETLRQLEANNPHSFEAMYQGNPKPGKGGWFERDKWRFRDVAQLEADGEIVKRVRVWDLAATKDGGDQTVGALWGLLRDGTFGVLDLIRVRLNGDEVLSLVQRTARVDGNAVKIMIEQEKAGSGKALIDIYRRRLRGFIVEPAVPRGDKETRAKPYNMEQAAGRVWLPVGAPWIDAWRDQHEAFTRTTHDDMVDTGSYATEELVAKGGGGQLMSLEELMRQARELDLAS